MISIAEHTDFIGFTLPATSVSSKTIPTYSSDVIFVNLYSLTLCIVYTISICLLTVWYYLPRSVAKDVIDAFIKQNSELTTGIRITSSTALAVEFITRLATCIVWTLNIENSLGILMAVWMPQIHLLAVAAIQILFIGIYTCCHEGSYQINSDLRTFSNLCATTFTLFYLLFPTIILMFAYPTQILVIFTFVTAYLFATSVYSASIIKLYNTDFNLSDVKFKLQCSCCCRDKKKPKAKHKLSCSDMKKWITGAFTLSNWWDVMKKIFLKIILPLLRFMIPWLVIVYLHFLVVFASYSMLIGRGSVINTGPLFLISLLPSAILSGGAWIAKRVALKGEFEDSEQESETVVNGKHKGNGISNGTGGTHETLHMGRVLNRMSHSGDGIQSHNTRL